MKTNYQKLIYIILFVLLVNFLGSKFYARFDLTKDKRYSLSTSTKELLQKVDNNIIVKVYLKGAFPAEFKRLQIETQLQLEEFKAINKNIQFRFINPSEIGEALINEGLEPSRLQVQEQGKWSEIVIFPWAVVSSKNKTEKVPLLKDIVSKTQNEQLESSIENLEYAFANAIHKVTSKKTKKIAILKGNGELNDAYLADFLKNLGAYYKLAPFTLDSVKTNPQKTFNQLKHFDLAIIAKPTEKFTEEEKFTLDQFIIQGGKTLWTIDNTVAELDSLMQTGESLAYPRDLNLTDLFFSYGLRINTSIVADLYADVIPLATGNIGGKTQFNTFLWQYYPILSSTNNHPINNNIEAVNVKFANGIDTLKNSIKKTVLLQSSNLSKLIATPSIISLKTITQKPNKEEYNLGNKPIAVLLEGTFKSAYSNRIKPLNLKPAKNIGIPTKMVVIADGDIIANDVVKGKPLTLGINKWTQQQFGNKEFLLNTVNYLLDDTGLISVRSKTVEIDFLNKQKAFEEAAKWQLLTIIFPLILLAVYGFVFNFFRRKKYS